MMEPDSEFKDKKTRRQEEEEEGRVSRIRKNQTGEEGVIVFKAWDQI